MTQLPRVPIISENMALQRSQKNKCALGRECVVEDGSLTIGWKRGLCLGSSFFFLRFVLTLSAGQIEA